MIEKRLRSPFFSIGVRAAMIVAISFFASCRGVSEQGRARTDLKPASIRSDARTKVADITDENLWPHERSDLNPDPAVSFGRLANGFRFVLMENRYPKDRVSMHLNVQAGSIHESEVQQGLAHFVEHMLFNGSENFKPGELVKYFQEIGMQFGPDANAHTGFKSTGYDILLPDGVPESLERGLTVMKDYAQGALLLPAEVERERRVMLAEKRTRDSASYRTYVRTLAFEFPEAIISKRLPIGQEEVLKTTERRQLKDFYDTWYRPEKMILVLVGDFDGPAAVSMIEKKFSGLTPRAPPMAEPDPGTLNHSGIKAFYHFEAEAGNTSVTIETLEKIPPTPDTRSFKKERVAADLAERIVQNRLTELVRTPKAPFTSAAIHSGYFLKDIKYAAISAESDPEKWEASLAAIEQSLRAALAHGFTEMELERVKKERVAELETSVKKASTRSSQDLAREIVWSLNADRVFLSPQQDQKLLVPFIGSLTLKEVNEAFRQTWSAGHRLVLVTGNADLSGATGGPGERILVAFRLSSRKEVKKPAELRPPVFPYLSEPENRGKIIQRTDDEHLGVVRIDFANGVRLNLKKTDFREDEVLVRLSFGRGRSGEPGDKPGLSELSEQVINESGLGGLTKDDLERALAGTNSRVVFGVDEDRLYYEGRTVNGEVLLMFRLLHAHLLDQGFRADAYSLSMERFAQKYQELSTSIEGAMKLSGSRFLAGGDTRFGLPAHEDFKRLTLDDVREWFESSLKTKDIEVSMVGDFDVDEALNAASVYLGSLPARRGVAGQGVVRPVTFPSGKSLSIPVATKIAKGIVAVSYPTDDIWEISRTRRLSVLAGIVSERLRENVREKLGSAYTTYAYNRPSRAYPGYGVFHLMVHVDPQEVEMIVETLKELAADLAEKGPSADELTRALTPTLTSIKDMMRENEYWLNTVLDGSEEHPRQLDWCRTIVQDYASITREEVFELAKIFLDNRRSATVIITPKPED